jgi:hypothetical protein
LHENCIATFYFELNRLDSTHNKSNITMKIYATTLLAVTAIDLMTIAVEGRINTTRNLVSLLSFIMTVLYMGNIYLYHDIIHCQVVWK